MKCRVGLIHELGALLLADGHEINGWLPKSAYKYTDWIALSSCHNPDSPNLGRNADNHVYFRDFTQSFDMNARIKVWKATTTFFQVFTYLLFIIIPRSFTSITERTSLQ